jgi:polyhydroxyalkanoate synthesis repressor PhaR
MAEESHLYKNGYTDETSALDEPGQTQPAAAIVIKKYANRRLYNTGTSTYVTLDDLAGMVRSGADFVVFDARTGEDLTHSVLTQIIVEQESKGQQTLLPIGFLRQLIRFYGNNIERLVPSYLEYSLDTLTREQEKYRKQFADTFGGAAIEAMNMFAPFTTFEQPKTPTPADTQMAPAEPAPRPHSDEIAELKSQLAEIQTQLTKIANEKK